MLLFAQRHWHLLCAMLVASALLRFSRIGWRGRKRRPTLENRAVLCALFPHLSNMPQGSSFLWLEGLSTKRVGEGNRTLVCSWKAVIHLFRCSQPFTPNLEKCPCFWGFSGV